MTYDKSSWSDSLNVSERASYFLRVVFSYEVTNARYLINNSNERYKLEKKLYVSQEKNKC